MHIFTSITANYIPKARVLAHSIKRHYIGCQFHLILCDHIPESIHINDEPFDSIITIAELPIPNFKSWLLKHSVVEMCTAVKGIAFQEIFRRYQCEKVIYLDPDIVVFDDLRRLSEKLDRHSVLLTPHQTAPEASTEAVVDNEICSLRHGVFNLGFLGVCNSQEGKRFLEWWSQRCQDFCYDDIPNGLFTDQRWADLIPAFFTDYHILRDAIYNVSTWNLTHRVATGNLETGILINNQALSFYHFSGFDSGAQETMLMKYGSHSPVLFDLRLWYISQCRRMEQEYYGNRPCAYSFFDNGETISKEHRLTYRDRVDLQQAFTDPFATASPEHSYFHWFNAYGKTESSQEGASHLDFNRAIYDLEIKLRRSEEIIQAMQSSKFWRLRSAYLRLKKMLAIRNRA